MTTRTGIEKVMPVLRLQSAAFLSSLDTTGYDIGTLAYVPDTNTYYSLQLSGSVDGVNVLQTPSARVWNLVLLANVGGSTVSQKVTLASSPADLTGVGDQLNISATETVLGAGLNGAVQGAMGPAVTTTDGTTWVTAFSFTPAANSGDDWAVSLMGLDVTAAPPITGNFYRADLQFSSSRIGTSAPVLVPATPAAANVQSIGAGSTYAVQVVLIDEPDSGTSEGRRCHDGPLAPKYAARLGELDAARIGRTQTAHERHCCRQSADHLRGIGGPVAARR